LLARLLSVAPVAVWCYVCSTGCSYPTEGEVPSSYVGQRFELQQTTPRAGQQDVLLGAPVDLFFNVPPDPDSVAAPHVRVFSGLIETQGKLKVHLVDRRIRFTPLETLRPDLRHQVYVNQELRGLNGAPLGQTVVFNFTTGSTDRWPVPQPPAEVKASDIQPLWDQRCTSCHRGPAPPGEVDLSSAGDALRTLRGAHASYGDKIRVVPGDHAHSYLMLKLLGLGGFVGFPMPPDGGRLPQEDLRKVATWIDGGAPP
jgi:hypothetical protein